MSRIDSVRQLVKDHSTSEFSAAVGIPAAAADPAAQTARVDCLNVEYVDLIVDVSDLGTGPITQLTVVGRSSSKAQPDVTTPADWQTINTESLDVVSGISTITPYQAQQVVGAVGPYIVTFPVRGRYFSALVTVDAATDSRGQIFAFRRGQE